MPKQPKIVARAIYGKLVCWLELCAQRSGPYDTQIATNNLELHRLIDFVTYVFTKYIKYETR